jgi:hypothetical protein
MNADRSRDCPQSWFLWGTILAGISSIPFIIMFFNAFRGMPRDKATGLGAVAGGLTEAYATFGFILTFVLPIAAIVLLGRSFSRGDRTRRLFSFLFIVWSSSILLVYVLGGWFVFSQIPRLVNGPR